ncbi:hypothetical protein Z043_118295 [Scleropages formosus]|uniref:Uncharacterized protein n=1 Tax=Scleropages formosus TaxID=113540 RepID=A0A0N8JXD7_SCLFO|nr:hypothetical protein Z043_118295 [Scleropages formosus]
MNTTTSLPVFQSVSHESGLHTRQLGDIEFSNRYAEYLRSKAKLNTLCSLLHRMKNSKNSPTEVDMDRVNALLKLYMCPNMYQRASDL